MVQPIQNTLPPEMGIGAILGTTFQVYCSQFSRFFLISLRAYAWVTGIVLVSTIVLAGVATLLTIVFGSEDSATSNLILGLIFILCAIIWIVLYLFSLAKFLANSALISKLAFNQLTNSTESPSQSCESIRPKTWAFFRISFYIVLGYVLVNIAMSIVGTIPLVILAIISGTSGAEEPNITIGSIVFTIVYIVAILLFYLWLFARWFVPEVVLAVEEITGAVDSIGRSWDLSKPLVLKLIVVAFLGFIMTAPIPIVVMFVPAIVTGGFDPGSSTYESLALLSFILNICISLGIMPFWQTLKGVLYYDMRIQAGELTFR